MMHIATKRIGYLNVKRQNNEVKDLKSIYV